MSQPAAPSRNRRFARNVSALAGGAAGGQLIIVAVSPLLTRLYSPEEFGILGVYTAILSIVAVIATLRYQHAIPLPRDDRDAIPIIALCVAIACAFSALSSLVVVLSTFILPLGTRASSSLTYGWMLSCGILFVGLYHVVSYWAIRHGEFNQLARTKLIQAITMAVIQVGAATYGAGALLVGHLFGQAGGVTTLLRRIGLRKLREIANVSTDQVVKSAARYVEFPLYSSWSALMHAVGSQLPALVLAYSFGVQAAGVFVLAHRILILPVRLVGRAVGSVYFSEISAANDREAIRVLTYKVHEKLTSISLPPILAVALFGPVLFASLFGEPWREAGYIAQLLAPWIFAALITSPLNALFAVFEKQVVMFRLHLLLFAARCGALVWGVAINDLFVAIGVYAAVSSLIWLLFLLVVMRLSGNSIIKVLKSIFMYAALAAIMIGPLAISTFASLERDVAAWLVTSSALMIGFYYIQLWRRR